MLKVKKLFFCCCFLLSLLIIEGRAEFLAESNDLDNMQQDTQEIDIKKAKLQDRLLEVETRYGEIAAELKNLQTQIDQVEQNLDINKKDRLAYQKEVDKHSKDLVAQIKAAYVMGRKEKLKMLLNQQDPILSTRIMLYYNYIHKARLKKLNDMQVAVEHQEQLEQKKQEDTQLLEKSLEQKQTNQTIFDDIKKQRHALLNQLMRDFSSRQQALNDLKESERTLKSLISTLQEGKISPDQIEETEPTITETKQNDIDFSTFQGKLPWPANGTVRKFGNARTKGSWDGVLINAKEGSEVRAVANGKVAFANALQGYGLLIIIDHGQGYMTVHGFNQSLYKRVGDTVTSGDIIAYVGKSGGRKHSGLYFAIRKQGMPIDPLSWCVKK